MNTININGATITKTESGVFVGMVEGTWFDAAQLAESISKVVKNRTKVKIYELMPGWMSVEIS